MAESICLRRAKASDIEKIVAIESRVQPVPWSRAGLLSEIERGRPTWFWCLCPCKKMQKVFAYICFRTIGDEAYLLNLAVEDAFQGLGHGSFLMECFFDFVRFRSCSRLVLDVHRENYRAIQFYLRHGFELSCHPCESRGKFLVMEMKLVR